MPFNKETLKKPNHEEFTLAMMKAIKSAKESFRRTLKRPPQPENELEEPLRQRSCLEPPVVDNNNGAANNENEYLREDQDEDRNYDLPKYTKDLFGEVEEPTQQKEEVEEDTEETASQLGEYDWEQSRYDQETEQSYQEEDSQYNDIDEESFRNDSDPF